MKGNCMIILMLDTTCVSASKSFVIEMTVISLISPTLAPHT